MAEGISAALTLNIKAKTEDEAAMEAIRRVQDFDIAAALAAHVRSEVN